MALYFSLGIAILIAIVTNGDIPDKTGITFNRKKTGTEIWPYVIAEDSDVIPNRSSYTDSNVKAMLKVISTRFSRVFTYNTDINTVHYERNVTYNYYTNARTKTAEMAARINREGSSLSLTVTIGIWDKDSINTEQTNTKLKVALEACKIAQSIYPGTVEGLSVQTDGTKNLTAAKETLRLLKLLRNMTTGLGVRIGTKQFCSYFKQDTDRDANSAELLVLWKEIFLHSDFIICSAIASKKHHKYGAVYSFKSIRSLVLKYRSEIMSINKNIEVMLKTEWHRQDINESKSDVENMRKYWYAVDNFAKENNYTVWLSNSHDGSAKESSVIGWWKLLRFDLINNVSGYVEKNTGMRANETHYDVAKDRSAGQTVTGTPSDNETLNTSTEPGTVIKTPHGKETKNVAEMSSDTESNTVTEKMNDAETRTVTKITNDTESRTVSEKSNDTETSILLHKGKTNTIDGRSKIVNREIKTIWIYGGFIISELGASFLTIIAYASYKKCCSSQHLVLSRQEIEEFRKGMSNEDPSRSSGNDYIDKTDALKQPYDTSFEISKGKLEIQFDQPLGGGEFGCVYKAILKEGVGVGSLVEVAVKSTKPNSGATALRGLLSEIKILSYIGKHPNIVSIVGAYTAEIRHGTAYVVTEICPLGSLKSYLNECADANKQMDKVSVPMLDMIRWSYEIACGMEYLDQKCVIHADLATRNVLLSLERTAKIADFGLSRRLYEYMSYTKLQQEPLPWRWMAVESLKMSEFSTKSDVWSYGVTLWEIFSLGSQPYPGLAWTVEFVENLEDGLRLKKPRYATTAIFEIMEKCWNIDSNARPSFAELKESTRQIQISMTDEYYTKLTDSFTESIA